VEAAQVDEDYVKKQKIYGIQMIICSNNPKHFHKTVSYIGNFFTPLRDFVSDM
jgi:hypothetical protein